MGVKELSDKGPDGTRLGQSASDLIGFHGASPTDQAAVQAALSTQFVSIGGYGFSTSTAIHSIVAAIDAVTACLREKGLMASS